MEDAWKELSGMTLPAVEYVEYKIQKLFCCRLFLFCYQSLVFAYATVCFCKLKKVHFLDIAEFFCDFHSGKRVFVASMQENFILDFQHGVCAFYADLIFAVEKFIRNRLNIRIAEKERRQRIAAAFAVEIFEVVGDAEAADENVFVLKQFFDLAVMKIEFRLCGELRFRV